LPDVHDRVGLQELLKAVALCIMLSLHQQCIQSNAMLLLLLLQVWQKDVVKLTMRERLAAKARKEDMLAHSITSSISAAVAAAPESGGAQQ
jgi:hypothetical protein